MNQNVTVLPRTGRFLWARIHFPAIIVSSVSIPLPLFLLKVSLCRGMFLVLPFPIVYTFP
jgi:hypothetical protein